jgi:hypothetical protein
MAETGAVKAHNENNKTEKKRFTGRPNIGNGSHEQQDKDQNSNWLI